MKIVSVILAGVLLTTTALWAQRPTPTVVGGATSAGVPVTLLTDASGNLYTLPSGSVATSFTPNSAYPTSFTPLNSVLLTTSSGTVATASTVLVGTLYCANYTTSSAKLFVTDTAGLYIVGSSAGFEIPASSVLSLNFSAGKLATGVKWWSDTATAIRCSLTGWTA